MQFLMHGTVVTQTSPSAWELHACCRGAQWGGLQAQAHWLAPFHGALEPMKLCSTSCWGHKSPSIPPPAPALSYALGWRCAGPPSATPRLEPEQYPRELRAHRLPLAVLSLQV